MQFYMLSGPTHPLFACNNQWKFIGGLTPLPPLVGAYVLNGRPPNQYQIDKDVENIYFKIPDQAMEYIYKICTNMLKKWLLMGVCVCVGGGGGGEMWECPLLILRKGNATCH